MPSSPRLRSLDFQPAHHNGQPMWFLRDPWQMGARQLVFPHVLAQMLPLLDGTRTVPEIYEAFCEQIGQRVPSQIIDDTLAQLDGEYLLDNERAAGRRRELLAEYHAQPFRLPALADISYPGEPQALSALFRRYERQGNAEPDAPPVQWRAVVSPHIDYQRGGPVYARVWRRAEPVVLSADLVLIFGTDHNGSAGSITLTSQPYATPYGILPTDAALIERLARALGVESAFAEELNHRVEHSVELSAVWLHYLYDRAGVSPPAMIPILVGSFHHFISNGTHPGDDQRFNRFLAALRRETEGHRVLVVGSVDLAHVGPAFGDPFHMDRARRTQLRTEDHALTEAVMRGDATTFYHRVAHGDDRNRICGFSPLYLMLRHLGPASGVQVAYEHCPADDADTSLVSICGLLLA